MRNKTIKRYTDVQLGVTTAPITNHLAVILLILVVSEFVEHSYRLTYYDKFHV